jgi:rubrerythrin
MTDHKDFFSAAAALGAVKQLDVDAMKLLFRVERSGEDFYNGVADRIGDDRAADLLRKNGREERGHAERMRRAIGVKLGHPWEPTPEDLERYSVPLPDAISAPLLNLMVQAEFDGDAGYQHWADREPDPEVQRLLRQNGKEETVHGQRVTEVIAILGGTTSGS